VSDEQTKTCLVNVPVPDWNSVKPEPTAFKSQRQYRAALEVLFNNIIATDPSHQELKVAAKFRRVKLSIHSPSGDGTYLVYCSIERARKCFSHIPNATFMEDKGTEDR